MPNKLIKLENNKFKDFVNGILGWNDYLIAPVSKNAEFDADFKSVDKSLIHRKSYLLA